MLELSLEDVEAPVRTRAANQTHRGFRLVASKEKRGGYVVELAMEVAKMRELLGLKELENGKRDEVTVSFIPAVKAVQLGLGSTRHIVVSAPIDGKSQPVRMKSVHSAHVRVGTFKWDEDTLKMADQTWLNKVIEPLVVTLAGKPAMLFQVPEEPA